MRSIYGAIPGKPLEIRCSVSCLISATILVSFSLVRSKLLVDSEDLNFLHPEDLEAGLTVHDMKVIKIYLSACECLRLPVVHTKSFSHSLIAHNMSGDGGFQI